MSKPADVTLGLRFLRNTWNQATEAQRLRQALKMLLRAYGLQAVDIRGKLPSPEPGLDVELSEPPFHPEAVVRDLADETQAVVEKLRRPP